MRSERIHHTTKSTTLITPRPRMRPEVQPQVPPMLIASSTPPTPPPRRAAPIRSRDRPAPARTMPSGTASRTTTIKITPTSAGSQNVARQPRPSMTRPTIRAAAMERMPAPHAVIDTARGTVRLGNVSRISAGMRKGIDSAGPCSMRPTMRTPKFGRTRR